jgi:hypothetical protein
MHSFFNFFLYLIRAKKQISNNNSKLVILDVTLMSTNYFNVLMLLIYLKKYDIH